MILSRCADDKLIEDFRPQIVLSLVLMKLLGQLRQSSVSGEAAAHHPVEKIFLRPVDGKAANTVRVNFK